MAITSARLGALFLIAHLSCLGASFCAVRVYVTDLAGKPRIATVRLVDGAGKIVEQAISDHGEVDFCDFGFGDHSIEVAPGTFGHVVIPHVRVVFGMTLRYQVCLNTGGLGDIVLDGCTTYFRITSRDGKRLPDVLLSSEPPTVHSESDGFGRALVHLEMHAAGVIEFSKPGYIPVRVGFDCAKPAYLEESVALAPVE